MRQGGIRKLPARTKARDPRTAPPPPPLPAYGGTPIPKREFQVKVETHPAPAPHTVSRKRIKPEWKEEAKVETTSVSHVVQELCNAITSNDFSSFQFHLSRLNGVYIHRLRQTEPAEVVKHISTTIKEARNVLPYGDDLIYLLKSLFVLYDISQDVSDYMYECLDSTGDIFFVSGSLFTLGEILLKSDKISFKFCKKAVEFAKKILAKFNEDARVLAIQFLIAYLRKTSNRDEKKDLCYFIMVYCSDRNPKIRRFAIEGIENFFIAEKTAPLNAYVRFTQAYEDGDKFVRLATLRIVKLYADMYPNEMISEGRKVPLRLVDDAFTTVCHAMNDLEVDIRAQAAQLLGSFKNVTESFLFQTLDKKLMKNMKRLADGRMATGPSTEWSTGKRLGEDLPADVPEEKSDSIIPTGTCGAFVTALEDEFKAVRQPAVYSLGKLAADRPSFANACIDTIADMFNDEIAGVRIDAIRALTPLVAHGVLKSDQLSTLLTGLEELSQESRIALLELLSRSNFTQTECVRVLLDRLVKTLERFPRDKLYVFQCAGAIGARHPHLLADIVADVYHLHPFFTRVEESINDQRYLVKLMLILNAAAKSDAVCSLLPAYVKVNYRFIRLTMPDLVPSIALFDNSALVDDETINHEPRTSHNVNQILGKEFSRLIKIQRQDKFEVRQGLYERFLQDVAFFLKGEPEYAHGANYLHSLAIIMSLMDKIMNSIKNNNIPLYLDIQEALQKIYFLEFGFHNISPNILYHLLEYSLSLNITYSGLRLFQDPKNYNDTDSIFQDELKRVQRRLLQLEIEPTTQLGNLMRYLLDAKSPKMGQSILSTISNHRLMINEQKEEFDKIVIKSVKIIEPIEIKKYSLMIALPTGVSVSCILSNFTEDDIKKFRVKVKYADDTSSYFLPPRSDFTKLDERRWNLQTHVLVTVREGIAAISTVQFFFGLFFPRSLCSSVLFYDRCYGFLPSLKTSANANGQFLALPDTDDLLSIATCSVKTEPLQVRKVS